MNSGCGLWKASDRTELAFRQVNELKKGGKAGHENEIEQLVVLGVIGGSYIDRELDGVCMEVWSHF